MKLRRLLGTAAMAAGLITGQVLMAQPAFAETAVDTINSVGAPKGKYTGECLAAYRMANQIKRGGTFYEDFSYPHASRVVSDNNDALADLYYGQPGAQFDKGQIAAWFATYLQSCTRTDKVVMA